MTMEDTKSHLSTFDEWLHYYVLLLLLLLLLLCHILFYSLTTKLANVYIYFL